MESLPALYIIFTLLNAFRRGIPRQNIWREFRRQGIALRPRLSFWLAVCIQAHLLANIEAPQRYPLRAPMAGNAAGCAGPSFARGLEKRSQK